MRAARRAALDRIRAKVRQWVARWEGPWWTPERREAYVRRSTETRAACSCPMCGNPRKWFDRKTLQERRAAQPEQEGP